jgi:hypothetical protein
MRHIIILFTLLLLPFQSAFALISMELTQGVSGAVPYCRGSFC